MSIALRRNLSFVRDQPRPRQAAVFISVPVPRPDGREVWVSVAFRARRPVCVALAAREEEPFATARRPQKAATPSAALGQIRHPRIPRPPDAPRLPRADARPRASPPQEARQSARRPLSSLKSLACAHTQVRSHSGQSLRDAKVRVRVRSHRARFAAADVS